MHYVVRKEGLSIERYTVIIFKLFDINTIRVIRPYFMKSKNMNKYNSN